MWPVGECSISRHWEHLKLRPVKVINEPLIISLTKYCAMARIRYLFRKGKRILCLFILGNCRYKILYKSTICWLFSFRFIFFSLFRARWSSGNDQPRMKNAWKIENTLSAPSKRPFYVAFRPPRVLFANRENPTRTEIMNEFCLRRQSNLI